MEQDKLQTNQTILKFDKDHQTSGAVLEDPQDFQHSIFNEVYNGAFHNILEIINFQEKFKKSQPRLDEWFDNTYEINNVISLVGTRGSGKSSALLNMRSFLNQLNSANDNKERLSNFIQQYPQLTNYQFYTLPIIDPTKIGTNESIIGSISARLYHDYLQSFQSVSNYSDPYAISEQTEQKRRFIQLVKEVNQAAVDYADEKFPSNSESEDMLSKMVKVETLRSIIHKMMLAFMKMKNPQSTKDSYFLIFIDDLDMNIKRSYDLLEEIRKFLMIPNVIIFISVSLSQLKSSLDKQFTDMLSKTASANNNSVHCEAHELAQQYLQKIIPEGRIHHLPVLDAQSVHKISIDFCFMRNASNYHYRKESKDGPISLSPALVPHYNNESKPCYPSIQEIIFHLIYRKTLLILVSDPDQLHPLIAKNLRSLNQLLTFLENLPDIFTENTQSCLCDKLILTDADYNQLEFNIDKLNQYIQNNHNEFMPTNMSETDLKIANTLKRIVYTSYRCPLEQLNAHIVRALIESYDKETQELCFGKITDNISQAEVLFDASFTVDTISMGDVLFVLGKMAKKTSSYEIRKLIGLVRIIWSLRMIKEYYRPYHYTTQKILDEEKNKQKASILEAKINEKFRKIVGGFMINPDNTSFLFENNIQKCDDWVMFKSDEFQKKLLWSENNISAIFTISRIDRQERNEHWRQYRCGGKNYYQTLFQYDANIKANYMSLFTNLLSPETVFFRTIRYISNFKISSLQFTQRLNEIENIIITWYINYHMIFPFHQMELIDSFYKKAREENRLQSEHFEYDEKNIIKKVGSLWSAFYKSMLDISQILKSYIPKAQTDHLTNAILYCPFNMSAIPTSEKYFSNEQCCFLMNDIAFIETQIIDFCKDKDFDQILDPNILNSHIDHIVQLIKCIDKQFSDTLIERSDASSAMQWLNKVKENPKKYLQRQNSSRHKRKP